MDNLERLALWILIFKGGPKSRVAPEKSPTGRSNKYHGAFFQA